MDCFVTVHGTVDPVTGMVTDIGALDRVVQEKVVKVFDRQDLRHVFDASLSRAGNSPNESGCCLCPVSRRVDWPTFTSSSLAISRSLCRLMLVLLDRCV